MQAYKANLYGPHIVWVFIYWLDSSYLLQNVDVFTSCTQEQLLKVMDRSLFTGPTFLNPIKEKGITGIDVDDFEKRYLSYFNNTYIFGSVYRMPSYDSIVAAALALNITLTKLINSGKIFL